VGAFLYARNAADTYNTLKNNGYNAYFENYQELTRVIATGIPAKEITVSLEKLKKLGFDSVIIREESGGHTISEKWIITEPESRFASFEFNQDSSYIAAERQAEASSPFIHFGEYIMPRHDQINMIDLGTLHIEKRNGDDIDLSFSPVNEPEARTAFSAVKEKPMPNTPETDLFTRTWVVTNTNMEEEERIGMIFLFSINGTYLVSRPDGTSFTSHWRWYNDEREEIEYSHDNWRSYGRATVNTLRQELLIIDDPGFNSDIVGFSSLYKDWFYELVPVSN